MTKRISRRLFLSGAFASAALPVWANPPSVSLRPVLRPDGLGKRTAPAASSLIRSSGISGEIGFAVADAKTGLVLEGHQPAAGVPPASVTKALTAMYALDVLGADYRFETTLVTTGTIKNGVLGGDLVLVGGGDPTLDTDALANMAAQLKEAGVREVKGQFLVYGGALPFVRKLDPLQPDHAGYSPAISGLNLNYNRVHFEWKHGSKGWVVTMDARSKKYRPDVSVAKMKVTSRSVPVYTYEARKNVDHWTVASRALGKGGARWLPVRQPELYAGDVFRTLARANGIVLGKARKTNNRPAGQVVVRYQSGTLRPILKAMLKYSTNLTAEVVGMTASKRRGAPLGSLEDSANEMNRWARDRLGMTHAALVDHSGLGANSRLRPAELVSALAKAGSQTTLQPILKEFKFRDQKGRPVKRQAIHVAAKTGTLNFVSGLAGYMTAQDGTELAFAIFAVDADARRSIKEGERERPPGARTWNRKAKQLQQKLIERWDILYGA
ncbi:D-alanyl-D-alanine carboxypeptidase/D-alanyl-D-alanine-endopeptidase [Shimia thalassica]|uniref:D-alanyl-D-alanine carboxypeptidase/D-alanyl-D-alanine endopeptidase n=1 Tax=Shimia thalassica TaxID=1715693 RepID=UPI0026E37453|nr:D-alanyl-D-alanine carboxypeptidase/D-alanyl-D-alanine-endopeptidase [Shimia thalassica]MDO6521488.1 D-alanyl-D-alanine carboxypeptidase/D-alanyl-D-alanine-endopeptidase [Shimia thalassica]